VGDTLILDDVSGFYPRDGISITFWNGAEPMKQVTAEEKARLMKTQHRTANNTYSSTYSTNSYWHRKETGIKIEVDEGLDDDAPEEKKPEETSGEAAAEPKEQTNNNDNAMTD